MPSLSPEVEFRRYRVSGKARFKRIVRWHRGMKQWQIYLIGLQNYLTLPGRRKGMLESTPRFLKVS